MRKGSGVEKAKSIFTLKILLVICFINTTLLADQQQKIQFKIEKQPLGNALLVLAEQSNRQLFVRSSLLGVTLAPTLEGDYTITEALTVLLEGTPLKGEITTNGRIKVIRNRGYINSDVEPIIRVPDPSLEEVVVTGLRYAQESSYQLKKNGLRIQDVLSEADSAKLPDGNVADSLQRLNGIQIERRNGDGTRFRIRGFDKNVTLYNGEQFLTGLEYFQLGLNDQSYENSIETLPVELLRRIEVYKSIRASDIEGAIGGTIDLISRDAFDVEDYLLTGEVKLDYGKFAEKIGPELFLGAGRNWGDKFAALFTINYAERTMHMDLAENYIERNPFESRSVSLISEYQNEDGVYQFDYLAPIYTGLADIEQARSQLGTSLSLGWRPNENIETKFEWFGIRSGLEQRNYEWLTAVDGAGASGYTFNTSYALPYLTRVDYATGDEIFRTVGETFDTAADNLNLQILSTPNQRWELSGRFSYSTADYTQNLGNADLVTLFNTRFLPVWIGEGEVSVPGLPNVSSSTGWTSYFNLCERCQNPEAYTDSYRYDLNSSTYTQLNERESINFPEDTFGALSQAKGATTAQDAIFIRGDAKYFIDESEENNLTFGIRLDNRETTFTQYKFLSDLSSTEGVARPALFDENGNVISGSDFSPSRPGDKNNVGIALPRFYDLCGNGGIDIGEPCDIDRDGVDDNSPYGPWVAELNPTSQPDALNVFGVDYYTPSLYGQAFGFNAPGYIPWRAYDDFPEDYTVLNDFYPTGTLPSHRASFVAGDTISTNVAAWIDRMAPSSPTQQFAIAPNSWFVEQETEAAYVEYNHVAKHMPLHFNLGVRYVATHFTVTRAVVSTGSGISFTPDEWYESGVGTGWRTERVKNTYRSVLPAGNFIWSFNDEWKVRLSAAKTIARPSFRDLGRGDSPEYSLQIDFDDGGSPTEFKQALSMRSGNPNLKPATVEQGDVSLEYYGKNASYAQLVFFYKGIDGQVINGSENQFVPDESIQGSTLTPVAIPVNAGRTHARGVEISLQKTWLSGFGLNVNYTRSDVRSSERTLSHTSLGLPGVSDQTFNSSGFYENSRFSVLLTYAWRDAFLAPYDGITGANKLGEPESIRLAHQFKAYSQWDARFVYFHDDLLSVSLDLLNLTQSEQKSYLEYSGNSRSRTVWEPRIILGLQLNF